MQECLKDIQTKSNNYTNLWSTCIGFCTTEKLFKSFVKTKLKMTIYFA